MLRELDVAPKVAAVFLAADSRVDCAVSLAASYHLPSRGLREFHALDSCGTGDP